MTVLVNVTRCTSPRCHAKVVFAKTERNRSMPVDAEPHADGMLRLYWRDEILRVEVVPSAERELWRKRDGGLHRSHFASCADAAYYRRRPR